MTAPDITMEAPRRPDHLSEQEWTQTLGDGPVRDGRESVENAPEFAKMREAPRLLDAHARTFHDRIETVRNDDDLTPAGRERRVAEIAAERDERLTEIVRAEYDRAEASLLDRYGDVEPRPLPLQKGDASRAQLTLAKLDRLSPERGIALVEDLVKRGDRIVVQEVLDVFADLATTRADYGTLLDDVPVGELDPVSRAVRNARVLLTGATNHAARYARAILPEARADLDNVLDVIREEGRWTGSIGGSIEVQRQGRPAGRLRWLTDPAAES